MLFSILYLSYFAHQHQCFLLFSRQIDKWIYNYTISIRIINVHDVCVFIGIGCSAIAFLLGLESVEDLEGSVPNIWGGMTIEFVSKKANVYIAFYPVLRTVQSALHFTSLTDLFTQTPYRLLWEASSHVLQIMRHLL